MKAHAIYVVIGSTGEYSDHSEWPVLWRATLEEAQTCVKRLNAEALDFQRTRDTDESGWSNATEQAYRAAMLDPQFSCDYTGTEYHVWTVLDDPRGAP